VHGFSPISFAGVPRGFDCRPTTARRLFRQ
jgi:hypothetical protein